MERADPIWATDLTDVRRSQGFVSLVALMDWDSRDVLSWEVSVTLDRHFCVSALARALIWTPPEIFNSDQGAQCTSLAFTEPLLARGMLISMDGGGRVFDNIFVARRWRRMK
jgi:putative transposase